MLPGELVPSAGNSWIFGSARLTVQSDGNLVIYDRRNGAAKWSTVLYCYKPGSYTVFWVTNTVSEFPPVVRLAR